MIMKIPKYSLWKESKHLNTSFHTPNKWKIILITSLKIWVLNYINVSDYNDNQIVFWFTQFLYIGSHSYWWNFKQCICKYHGQRHSLVELNNLILHIIYILLMYGIPNRNCHVRRLSTDCWKYMSAALRSMEQGS